MKYFKNPYFSSDNKDYVSIKGEQVTPERMKAIKLNNSYVISVLSNIIFKGDEFLNAPSMKKYMPTILAGNPARKDNITGYNSNNLGEKVKFLVLALSDKNHPENMQKVKNSFFVQSIMMPLFTGSFAVEGSEDRWELYQKTTNDPYFKNMNAINAATKCYLNDPEVPVGIDMSTLIDGLVGTDSNGNYYLISDIDDLKVKENMVAAMKEHINLLKSNKKFKANYNNPNIIEDELEDEDE